MKQFHQRGHDANQNGGTCANFAEQASIRECRSRHSCDFGAGKCFAVIVTAAIGHNHYAPSAAHQFAGQRLRRKKVATSTAGSKDKSITHNVTSSGKTGRWRVRPSANPMVSAIANRDEPP